MMAEVLDAFPERERVGRYPWDDWLNGQIWKLKRGEDFMCKVGSFRNYAYARAAGRRLALYIDGDYVYLQARAVAFKEGQ
jgi:hypothetical protein